MDKHERVADEIVGYISGGDIGTGSISELAFAVLQLAAILRREYGADRNAAVCVWERMRYSCDHLDRTVRDKREICCYEGLGRTPPCSFSACPLLKEDHA